MSNSLLLDLNYNYNFISILIILYIFNCYFYNYMSIIEHSLLENSVFKAQRKILSKGNLQLFSTAGLTFYGQAGLFFGHNAVEQTNQ